MKRVLLTVTALIFLSGSNAVAQPGPMPVVSGLKTVPMQHGMPGTVTVAPAAPAPKRVATVPAGKHDCAIFYMGAGGDFFASAIRHQAENFRIANPRVTIVEVRYHVDMRAIPAACKNPLIVGHSMGARRAIIVGNKARRGRVISIDVPNWIIPSMVTTRPTMNFFSCPPSPFGCGKVRGATNIDLSAERRGHVGLPYSRRITAEVTR